MVWYIVYLILGIILTLFILGLDIYLKWSWYNLKENFSNCTKGDKFFFITLPFSWGFLLLFMIIVLPLM